MGGAEIYKLALPQADRIYLTEVDTTIEDGDTQFPPLDPMEWLEVGREEFPAGPNDPFACRVITSDRRPCDRSRGHAGPP